jgi:hypothetical protein
MGGDHRRVGGYPGERNLLALVALPSVCGEHR